MSGNQATKNGAAAVVGVLAVLAIIAGLGMTFLSGQDDNEATGPEDRESARLVVFTGVWGHFEPGGGTNGNGEPTSIFVGDDRDLTITYFIDGVPHAATRDEVQVGVWAEYLAIHPGAEVRLLIEQHGTGGFLLCSITVNGRTLTPDGYMRRNDAGDCEVSGTVQ